MIWTAFWGLSRGERADFSLLGLSNELKGVSVIRAPAQLNVRGHEFPCVFQRLSSPFRRALPGECVSLLQKSPRWLRSAVFCFCCERVQL